MSVNWTLMYGEAWTEEEEVKKPFPVETSQGHRGRMHVSGSGERL